MRLLPSSDQITSDLNDLKLRIAKMNARRNAQINMLQKKILGESGRSKYYPWSRDYSRGLYYADPTLYALHTHPWRSPSLDSLELDRYYDSLNSLDDKTRVYEPNDEILEKCQRTAKYPANSDLLSKLKDFVFEQERQMTTDLLRKISTDRKLHPSNKVNYSNRESKSLNRVYNVPDGKRDLPFLNPINKKDNFCRRYNAFIKKILKPLKKSSPTKYEPQTAGRLQKPATTSTNSYKPFLSTSYHDEYYPSRFYRPYYWYRYSYPFYRRYLNDYDYDYWPKLQPAAVPQDVESIIRKSNHKDEQNLKLTKNSNYKVSNAYKYDPFESDSYLRSSLPTWKQYYYTQKLKSKPSNESYLDYYDPYYDFFSDRASIDATDDLMSNDEDAELDSDDAKHLIDQYRDAIYEDIIRNLKQKQSKKNKNVVSRSRSLVGYRVKDAKRERFNARLFSDNKSKDDENAYSKPTYQSLENSQTRATTTLPYRPYGRYSPQENLTPSTYAKEKYATLDKNTRYFNDNDNRTHIASAEKEKNNFDESTHHYESKLPNDNHSKTVLGYEIEANEKQNTKLPSTFYPKYTTPVYDTFDRYSAGNSPLKTQDNTLVGSINETEYTPQERKLEQYEPSDSPKKPMVPLSYSQYGENKDNYGKKQEKINNYVKSDQSPTRFGMGNVEKTIPMKEYSYSTDQFGQCSPTNSPSKSKIPQTEEQGPISYSQEMVGAQPTNPNSIPYESEWKNSWNTKEIDSGTGNKLMNHKPRKLSTSTNAKTEHTGVFQEDAPSRDRVERFTPTTSPSRPKVSKNDSQRTMNYLPDVTSAQTTNLEVTESKSQRRNLWDTEGMKKFEEDESPVDNRPRKESINTVIEPDTLFNKDFSSRDQTRKYTPLNSPSKSKAFEDNLQRTSDYLPETDTANVQKANFGPAESKDQHDQPQNLRSTESTGLGVNERLTDSRYRRLPSTDGARIENSEVLQNDYEYPTEETINKRGSVSSTETRQRRQSKSETAADNKSSGENSLIQQQTKEDGNYSVTEKPRRLSSSKGTTPSEKVAPSRRNSIILDNKSSVLQSASRRNSIKPTQQRKNSIQPVTEKRNLLQKMSEAKYEADRPNNANEYSAASAYNKEEQKQNEVSDISHSSSIHRSNPCTRSQPNSNLNEYEASLHNNGEKAKRRLDNIDNEAYSMGVDQTDYHQYDYNANEISNTDQRENSGAYPETGYYEGNPSSYDENNKESYGRSEQYPNYDYHAGANYDNSRPENYYLPDQTYQTDSNYNGYNDYQNNYPHTEGYTNDYNAYYNQHQPTSNYMTQEYTNPSNQYHEQSQPGFYDDYSQQDNAPFTNQSNADQPRKSFGQLGETADIDLINQNQVREVESKEQEQLLNSINEEAEKADEGLQKNDAIEKTVPRRSSTENSAELTNSSMKPKQSADAGRVAAPAKELTRRASRSTLPSPSPAVDEKKLKNQSSTGELQKRTSKPKVVENKFKRTASTIKPKPSLKKT